MTDPASALERFEVIVVGAGVCGCVMAGRLAEAGLRTALVEAGPAGPLPSRLARGDLAAGRPDGAPDWFRMSAELSTGDDGRRIPYLQGRGTGGGSAVNGMVLSAGIEADYTPWHRWLDDPSPPGPVIERCLQRALDRLRPETSRGGPVTDVFDHVVGERWGLTPGPASSVLGGRGLLPVAVARRNRNRLTVADAYLDGPVLIRPRTPVRRLDHRRGRVVGVVTGSGDRLTADHVVLCAGPLQSPALLMRSGLAGDSNTGVTRPSTVWQGLDHPAVGIGFDWPATASTPSTIAEVRRLVRGHLGSESRTVDATIQVMGPFPAAAGPMGFVLAMTEPIGAPVEVAMSVDGTATIDRRWLRPGADGRSAFAPWLVRELVELTEALVAELHPGRDPGAAGAYIDHAGTPAATLTSVSDDGIEDWIRDNPAPLYHLGGTVTESTDMVRLDPDRPGSVDGVAGLTIADSSTMPGLVGGGVQLAAMAWAEFLVEHLVGRPSR